MNLKKRLKKIFISTGLFPYPYYVYRHNRPYQKIAELMENRRSVIFDVGENTGTSISILKSLVRDSQIYSFEPDPKTFRKLKAFSETFNDVSVHNLAFSDLLGSLDFHVTASNLASSLLEPVRSTDSGSLYYVTETIKVEASTIDFFAFENKIDQIDLLKLDTQGSELSVLKGAQELIRSKKIKLIYVEVEFQKLYENQCLYHDIASFLDDYQYHLYSLYNISINKKGEVICADALFLPS